jgi:hypothetical protein
MTIEKVSQDEMLQQFKERFAALIEENKRLGEQMRANESTALKLQGAIEALEYYNPETESAPPEDEEDEDLAVGTTD